MRKSLPVLFGSLVSFVVAPFAVAAPPPMGPHLLQKPALTETAIIFNYAGDLWSVDRKGGRANRLTIGVGIETSPIVSPDGKTIAFSGEYDGNTDVYTIPITGGVPKRVTYHPATDVPVAWTPDSKQILFRSERTSSSRYVQLFEVSPEGGVAKVLPLPMAYQGELSADGKWMAYSPLAPAFGFNYTSYVSWGNYHGGRAGTVNVTNMSDLTTVTIPHDKSSDFSPVWMGNKVYFLSDRNGPTSLFSYDPTTKAVTEVLKNSGPEMHSLASGPGGLVYDQLGEIYLWENGKAHKVEIDVTGDLPEVRERIATVSSEIENAGISPTGVRAVFEAHGEILTVPAKKGPTRDLTNTPGVMEREPVWAPDGQSIAYFSDESGLYAVHVASQDGSSPVKKFPISNDAAYYFSPKWSPDSKKLAFYDNRLNLWMLDVTTGKATHVGEANYFSEIERDYAWSPDSKWLAYTRVEDNHLHSMYLYSTASGESTMFTGKMADARYAAFDRNGKYLYFTAGTNEGGTAFGLDMTSDLLQTSRSIYALVLANDAASPLAPESDDEKTLAEAKEHRKDMGDEPAVRPGGGAAAAKADGEGGAEKPSMPVTPNTKPTKVDLAGLEGRIVALPLPPAGYADLDGGKAGGFFFLERGEGRRGGATLKRFSLESRKAETVAERVREYALSANGEKVLLAQARAGGEMGEGGPGRGGAPSYSIVPATPMPAGGGSSPRFPSAG